MLYVHSLNVTSLRLRLLVSPLIFIKYVILILQRRKRKYRRIKLLAPVHIVSVCACRNLRLDIVLYGSSTRRKRNPSTQKGESVLLLIHLVLDPKSLPPVHKLALLLRPNPPAAFPPVTPVSCLQPALKLLSTALGKCVA